MKKIRGIMLLVSAMLLSGCTISHTYGPYLGKVVEKGTGVPIEGAVVFVQFYTGAGNIGGTSSVFADAVETLTDADGEFLIPPHSIRAFRPLHGWNKNGYAIIFKPGYGAFPGHRGTTLTHPNGTLPANEPVVIELPKLKTYEERRDNLGNVNYPMSEVPCEKQRLILKLNNLERLSLGLEPEMTNICGDTQDED